MPNMSSDQLRDISVAVVEGFINNKIPLSQGLAKQAEAHDLNSDQVQRCVEVSNTVAHLKLLGMAEDRTFEFPLCKYAEVMRYAAAPSIEKSAAVIDKFRNVGKAVSNTLKDIAGKGQAGANLSAAKNNVAKAEEYMAHAKDPSVLEHDPLAKRILTNMAREDMGKAKSGLEAATPLEAAARLRAGLHATGAVAGAGLLGTGSYLGVKHYQNQREAKAYQEKRAFDKALTPSFSEHETRVMFIKEASANSRAVEDLEGRAVFLREKLIKEASLLSKDERGLDKIACTVTSDCVPALTSLIYGAPKQVRDFGAGKNLMFKQAELKQVLTLQELYKEARELSVELSRRRELQKRAAEKTAHMSKEAFSLAGIASGIGGAIGKSIGTLGGTAARVAAAPVISAGGAVKSVFNPKAKLGFGTKTMKVVGGGAATIGMNSMTLEHNPGINKVTGKSKDVWDSLQSN